MKKQGNWVLGLMLTLSITTWSGLQGQTIGDKTNVSSLLKISEEQDKFYNVKHKSALNFAASRNIPLKFKTPAGTIYQLQEIDALGLPVYYKTFNLEAAQTTRTIALYANGALGLNLTGNGYLIDVWDSGKVKNHAEFQGRLSYGDGATDVTNHATHVTGTLIASGINENAKGMAYEAIAKSFDWSNDISEMSAEAASGLLVSNHSYGVATGWEQNDNGNWEWHGGNEANEDYKFGYYSSKSKSIDDIAVNAPFYTIVWAAGNDRSDVGDGTRPADGPFDTVGPEGVAKNIITVGAVNSITNYTQPSNVTMANFSSWGPTDDGRIKPDLVGAGVSILSTTSGDGDNYGVLSGTSMACPNVSGSLLLLQQLYANLYAGQHMRSATLKALAIHSAKESGTFQGPDYQFGWGLLDVEAAAKLLIDEDDQDIIIREHTLNNSDVFELEFIAKSNEKITATLVWTDPSGTPAPTVIDPTTKMLVNDLDIKILDDGGNEVLPWTLNPASPNSPAAKGDNTRDNVEKIEFPDPEPRVYRIQVSHKGSLQGGSQKFSLIMTAKTQSPGNEQYFWIGDAGNWEDGSNWSLSSGGPPANVVPGSADRVFIDENSFSSTDDVILINGNVEVMSIAWLDKLGGKLNLADNNLLINENFEISGENLVIDNGGNFVFHGSGSSNNIINFNNNDLSAVNLVFDTEMVTWNITEPLKINSLTLNAGNVSIQNLEADIVQILSATDGVKSLQISNAQITGLNQIDLSAENLDIDITSSTFSFPENMLDPDAFSSFNALGIAFDGTVVVEENAKLELFGNNTYDSISCQGEIKILENNEFSKIKLFPGSTMTLGSGSTQTINTAFVAEGEDGNSTILKSEDVDPAILNFNVYKKICLDYLSVDNVNIEGLASVNAGLNSTLINSQNWFDVDCEDVLFADFISEYNCAMGNTQFNDQSSGKNLTWAWNFGDPSSNDNTSNIQNPTHTFSAVGDYDITLTVDDGEREHTYTKTVQMGSNDLNDNDVVENGSSLFSITSGASYQWYLNGEPIEGANERSYPFNGIGGSYYVVTYSESCAKKSSILVITGLEEEIEYLGKEILVYPNPLANSFEVEIPNPYLNFRKLTIVDIIGNEVYSIGTSWKESIIKREVKINEEAGIYFLRIYFDDKILTKRIIINN